PSWFWRFESFGANPSNRQLAQAFAARLRVPAGLLFAAIRRIPPSARRVRCGRLPSPWNRGRGQRVADEQVFANQASFALVNRSPFGATMTASQAKAARVIHPPKERLPEPRSSQPHPSGE